LQTENVRLRQELAEAMEAPPLNTAAMEDTEVESTLNSLMLVHTHPRATGSTHTYLGHRLGVYDVQARLGELGPPRGNWTAAYAPTEAERTSTACARTTSSLHWLSAPVILPNHTHHTKGGHREVW
jgi:hypothetical protein